MPRACTPVIYQQGGRAVHFSFILILFFSFPPSYLRSHLFSAKACSSKHDECWSMTFSDSTHATSLVVYNYIFLLMRIDANQCTYLRISIFANINIREYSGIIASLFHFCCIRMISYSFPSSLPFFFSIALLSQSIKSSYNLLI